jgi:hypothetical protein
MKLTLPETKSAESSLKTFLQYSALPLTLATALLFLLGWIYGTSYLAEWGLPESLFPLTKEGTIITGFFHLLVVFANNFSFITYGVILCVVVMFSTMIT